ncbi:hypothetical protein M404DRAFT_1005361, partial [Pisolithus tinctorius Marx 270]
PERHIGHRSLPTIPAEIYTEIFEYLAPPGKRLSAEQRKILTRVAGACKLLCHIALPRMYGHVDVYWLDNLSSLRKHPLFGRIAAHEDLALWAAKCVRECKLHGWLSEPEGSWTSTLRHMPNLRRLMFVECFITNEHWHVIMALGALEELVLHGCHFTETLGPEGRIQSNQPVKLRVPSVEFYRGCNFDDVAAKTLDLGCLHSLKADIKFARLLDWPQDCILEQLHISGIDYSDTAHQTTLKSTLRGTGQWVADLKLSFCNRDFLPDFESHLQASLPETSQNLRSLMLVFDGTPRDCIQMSSIVCCYVGFSETMERLAMQYSTTGVAAWWQGPSQICFARPQSYDVQDIIQLIISKVFPNINYVEIYGTLLHLEGGSWVNRVPALV